MHVQILHLAEKYRYGITQSVIVRRHTREIEIRLTESFTFAEGEADLVLNMRQTFDDMVRTGKRWATNGGNRLAEIFMMSSRLEGMLWEMATPWISGPIWADTGGPRALGSRVPDVRQALMDGPRQRVTVGQDPLAAAGNVTEHRDRVAHPADGVVQVPQVRQAAQRVHVVGTEDPLRIRAALLGELHRSRHPACR